jgi:hypothetical protein
MLRAALLVSLVMTACSGQPSSAPPAQSGPFDAEPAAAPAAAPTAAPTPAEPTAEPEQERDDGGFADPKIAEETAPAATSPAMTDPALIARVKQRFGEDCRPERSCGGLLGVDCKAAVDGPYYYVEQADLKVVSTCGGACMRGCTDCPPRAWACATY